MMCVVAPAGAVRAMDFETVAAVEGCAGTCVIARGAINEET